MFVGDQVPFRRFRIALSPVHLGNPFSRFTERLQAALDKNPNPYWLDLSGSCHDNELIEAICVHLKTGTCFTA